MKRLKRFRTELLFLLLSTVLALILVYWNEHRPQNFAVQSVLLALCLANGIALYRLFILLWKKWQKKLTANLKRLFAGASMLLMKLLDKWEAVKSRFTGKRKHTIFGKTTVTFDFAGEPRTPKPPKPPKWKNMQTDRQKLGYLYYHLITRRIKRGMSARPTDTPAELKTRAVNQPPEEQLFDLYIDARYDERVPLEEAELSKLKETLFGKKKKDTKKS